MLFISIFQFVFIIITTVSERISVWFLNSTISGSKTNTFELQEHISIESSPLQQRMSSCWITHRQHIFRLMSATKTETKMELKQHRASLFTVILSSMAAMKVFGKYDFRGSNDLVHHEQFYNMTAQWDIWEMVFLDNQLTLICTNINHKTKSKQKNYNLAHLSHHASCSKQTHCYVLCSSHTNLPETSLNLF